jgi:hypothetical protein
MWVFMAACGMERLLNPDDYRDDKRDHSQTIHRYETK